ncbi:MAG: 1-acyl-sn-glycerol-3-phosphate acyltransferase [Anaeromyxobacteraceae bacterium]|nr:1-acyl-sn-glycerol-3-phosphate acyltransferase [Anaeromyxobacteraceae bacterium]
MPAAGAVAGLVGAARAGARVAGLGAVAAGVALRTRDLPEGAERRLEQARLLSGGSQRTLALHGLEVDLLGSPPPGAALLACNHVSWLDPLVVAAVAPCAPISKLDVRGWPVFGPLAARLGVIFHARGESGSGLRVLREVEAALGAGVAVLNFPEGTTSDGAGVLRFKTGLFGLAARLGVPVVPVALRYEPADLAWVGDDTFVPHYLRLASRPGARVRVRLGIPVRAEACEDAAALAEVARAEVLSLLEAA